MRPKFRIFPESTSDDKEDYRSALRFIFPSLAVNLQVTKLFDMVMEYATAQSCFELCVLINPSYNINLQSVAPYTCMFGLELY